MTIESRDQAVALYEASRVINIGHQRAALDLIATAALVAHARRI